MRRNAFHLRPWLERAVFAVLVLLTILLGYLAIGALTDRPKRLFRSTDRYCSYLGLVDGRFVAHYDGGPELGVFKPRNWNVAGVFYKTSGGWAGWQSMDAGVDGRTAGVLVGAGWAHALWVFVLRSRWRRRRGRCGRCGYDLAGLVAGRCPECGAQQPLTRGAS